MIKMFDRYNKESEIIEFCRSCKITDYSINDDLSIDVYGSVYISVKKFERLPIAFNEVSGEFFCCNNSLTSMENMPKMVGGTFDCSYNNITSLLGGPEIVNGDYKCSYNELTDLVGSPKRVEKGFSCINNLLTTLEGAPIEVGDYFYCHFNRLSNLNHLPKYIGGELIITENYLPNIVMDFSEPKLIGEYQKEYGIWNSDGSFNRKRWYIFIKDYMCKTFNT